MKLITSLILSIFLAAAPISAQSLPIDHITPPLTSQSARKAVDILTYGTVGANIAMAVVEDLRGPDKLNALAVTGMRVGATVGIAEVIKVLIPRTRPDGSDNQSFFSEHTAIAFSLAGGPHASITIPLAVGTGAGRILAGKHYLTDVITGAAVGLLMHRSIQ